MRSDTIIFKALGYLKTVTYIPKEIETFLQKLALITGAQLNVVH